MEQYPTFQRDTRKPSRPPPPKSCDCQVHVFGDPAKFPLRSGGAYRPPADATFATAQRMHRTLGLERGVVVQSTVHGTDHRTLFDALAGQPNYRGIALIDDSVSDKEIERLHEVGVRGARFNFWKMLNIVPSHAGFERAIDRIKHLGWHAKIHATDAEWPELADLLKKVKIPAVIDHLGHLDIRKGVDDPVFRLLLDFVKRENWWMMVSNADRISAMAQSWDDVVPYARKFIETAPDRIIWCTDWPHVRYDKPAMPNDAELLELVYRFAPEPELQRKILADNPARLFGFELPAVRRYAAP
ncbi:MAG TPA: amidohydrolase family protein [Stellaceae bacterium]|nr:amidohydrolase family protein [Stellaceae bacterium]